MQSNNQPSLSELTNIQGNAEQGGSTVAEIKPSQAIVYLQHAAAAKAEADKYIYEKFQENLKTNLADAGKVDMAGLVEADYPELSKRFVEYSKKLADNFEVVGNPNSNLQMFSELKNEEAQLRADVAQSKQQKLVGDRHQEYLNQHPTWGTEANLSKLKNYLSAPRDKRETIVLDSPAILNIDAIGKTLSAVAEQKYAEAKTNGKYVTTTKGVRYDDASFDEAADGMYEAVGRGDDFGRSIKQLSEISFNGLSTEEKAQYGNAKKWFLETVKGFKSQNQVLEKTINEDGYGLEDQRQKNRMAEIAQNFKNTEKLRDEARKYEKLDAKEAGAWLVDESTRILTAASTSGKSVTLGNIKTRDKDGKEMPVSEHLANNISPVTKELFGYPMTIQLKNASTDAITTKNITISPDMMTYTDKGQLRPVFYKRNADGTVFKSDEEGPNKGKPVIDADISQPLSASAIKMALSYMVPEGKRSAAFDASNAILPNIDDPQSIINYANSKGFTKGLTLDYYKPSKAAKGGDSTKKTNTVVNDEIPDVGAWDDADGVNAKIDKLPPGAKFKVKQKDGSYKKYTK